MTACKSSPTLAAMANPQEILTSNAEAIVALESSNAWYQAYWRDQGARLRDDLDVMTSILNPGARLLDVGVNPPFMWRRCASLATRARNRHPSWSLRRRDPALSATT
jgi:hypothetical protein